MWYSLQQWLDSMVNADATGRSHHTCAGQIFFKERMKKKARSIFLILVTGIFFGCSSQGDFDQTLRSSDIEEISDLRLLMTKYSVPYRNTVPENGMEGFSYRSVDEPRMTSLRQKLNRQTWVTYEEQEAREYMQKLLTEMNYDFLISEKSDGIWIKWFPESEQQSEEIRMKVVQRVFDQHVTRASVDCQSSLKPTNGVLIAEAQQSQSLATQCR
jgi:hypothetical protein